MSSFETPERTLKGGILLIVNLEQYKHLLLRLMAPGHATTLDLMADGEVFIGMKAPGHGGGQLIEIGYIRGCQGPMINRY